jgi:hypothetical protein
MPTVTLPTLHSGQIAAWEARSRYTVLRCGRRFGKTALASTLVGDGAARAERWGIFAPDYKMTSETYGDIYEMLEPITQSASKIDGVIKCVGGGRVDFWTLNNPRAGRSRKYHGVIIDEAAFAGDDMEDIWTKSIKPTLLDYRGVAWAMSTPAGQDDDNWFYRICRDKSLGFVEFHAPSSANPYLPADEIAKLELENSPEVYRQEYLAEFVDWSGVAFFPPESLLVDGRPVPMPDKCDVVIAFVDTAIKTGSEHNSTGVVYASYNSLTHPQTVILGWDLVQIEGAAQAAWLPTVYAQLEEYARLCGARRGSAGVMIEDKATGTVLLQQAENLRRAGQFAPAHPIDSKLTALGKDERAIAASPHVYAGDVKISEQAFNKTKVHKQVSANHFFRQVTGFRIGAKLKDGLDLLDCFCYCVLLTRGNSKGF